MGYSPLFALGMMMSQHGGDVYPFQQQQQRACTTPPPRHSTDDVPPHATTTTTTTPSSPTPRPAHTSSLPPLKIPLSPTSTASAPALRKRKSSLSVTTHPMSAVKSPSKSAGLSFNRAVLMSPTSSGAGGRHGHSMTMSEALPLTAGAGAMGGAPVHESFTTRMRSGSLNGSQYQIR